MIIYGTGGKKLLTEQLNDNCPQCESDNSLEITIAAKYFHVFWIPFFPIGKTSAVYCEKCGYTSEIPSTSEQINAKSEELESKLSAPAYLSSGLVITLLVIIFFVFRGIEKNKGTEEYIYNPMAGDIYEIKTINDSYSLLRIEAVFNDSVYLCFHEIEVEDKSDLTELKTKKRWMKERFVYLKPELVQKYEEGYILSINRNDKIEDSGLFPYQPLFPNGSASKNHGKRDENNTTKAMRPQPAQ